MKSGLDHARLLLEKAGNDLKLVEIGLQHDAPTDTLAFHLQQTVEKTLKALLAFHSIVFPKRMTLTNSSIWFRQIAKKCFRSAKSSWDGPHTPSTSATT